MAECRVVVDVGVLIFEVVWELRAGLWTAGCTMGESGVCGWWDKLGGTNGTMAWGACSAVFVGW